MFSRWAFIGNEIPVKLASLSSLRLTLTDPVSCTPIPLSLPAVLLPRSPGRFVAPVPVVAAVPDWPVRSRLATLRARRDSTETRDTVHDTVSQSNRDI